MTMEDRKTVGFSPIIPFKMMKLSCKCEYCGCTNEKESGTCDYCGAPLPVLAQEDRYIMEFHGKPLAEIVHNDVNGTPHYCYPYNTFDLTPEGSLHRY